MKTNIKWFKYGLSFGLLLVLFVFGVKGWILIYQDIKAINQNNQKSFHVTIICQSVKPEYIKEGTCK